MLPFVFDVKHFAIHDGPGIRTTFFLKGCPLHCLWCQNPESMSPQQELMYAEKKCQHCGICGQVCEKIDPSTCRVAKAVCSGCGRCVEACPVGARKFAGRRMTPEELVEEAAEDLPFYRSSGGGITFSGGECLLYSDYLADVLPLCKDRGISVAIDTCGAVPWRNIETILPWADLFLYDVKLMDPVRHKAYTGVDNGIILENLRRLSRSGKDIIIRIPLIPGYTDHPEDVRKTAAFLKQELAVMPQRVELLPYNQLAEAKYQNQTAYADGGVGSYPLPGRKTQDQATLLELRDIVQSYGLPAFVESLSSGTKG